MSEFIGWLGHDDDNFVDVLYAGSYDSEKKQVRTLTEYLRRGLVIREIIDGDGAAKCWARKISEREMRKIAAAPSYSDDDGPAARIAEQLVAQARAKVAA